jgi:hypothetical protein
MPPPLGVDGMSLDHYVSQVHLKQFYSPALGKRMYGVKKSDLEFFQCKSEDVCRIKEGSTNTYLADNRAIEGFLHSVEPHYNKALAKLRNRNLDQESIAAISGFAAYVASCSPTAMRIHSGPLESLVMSEASILDRQGLLPKAPVSLGHATSSELLADGTMFVNVDKKFPQALGIDSIKKHVSIWGNSRWDVLQNSDNDCPFFTSDYPVALEARTSRFPNWIVPLAPDLAIRIIPDIRLSKASQDLSFAQFKCRHPTPRRSEIVEINRLIVRCAEDKVFYRDNLPWVHDFIEKNRYYRLDIVVDRITCRTRFVSSSTQRIVPNR